MTATTRPRMRASRSRWVPAGAAAWALVLLVAGAAPAVGASPRPGTTERVSVTSDGTQANGASAGAPAVSADGRHVAFHSAASNLVPGPGALLDVFVHDRATGTTEQVSVASDGTPGNASSFRPAISAHGRHVAFISNASNLVPGDTNGTYDIFVHDRQTGTTERVSVASDGTQANGGSYDPAISADGQHVAFESSATNLVPGDTNEAQDVFVHDRQTGTTERVSVTADGTQANGRSFRAALNADGRHVAFDSVATNLVPGDTNGRQDVFVHDRQTGTTERVSVTADGTQANGGSYDPAISADGQHVAFESSATNLVPGDTNEAQDVFVHDRQTRTTERVSAAPDGTEGNHHSPGAAISADGRHVAFTSFASNLVPDDTNGAWDIFGRDRGPVIGIGALEVQSAPGEAILSGWATFSGVTVASAEDPEDDGVEALGAEIAEASVIHRPEQEDLLLRLGLASLPGPEIGGAPRIIYRWSFTAGGTAYEVRALRAGGTAVPPATPYFALYECDLVCTETMPVSGAIGTTGADVRVAVPLDALGLEEGATLTDIVASSALGEATPGALVVLDEVVLPNAPISLPRVELGIAPASASQGEVAYTIQATLVDGRFSGTADTASLPPGSYRAWARACLGAECGTPAIPLTVEGG